MFFNIYCKFSLSIAVYLYNLFKCIIVQRNMFPKKKKQQHDLKVKKHFSVFYV